MRKPSSSIKTLFIISIIVVTSVLLALQTGVNVYQFRSGMDQQVQSALRGEAKAIAGQLDQRLLQIAQKTSGLALGVNQLRSYDTDVMFGLADGYIQSDPLVIGSGFWFEPRAYQSDIEYYGPYRTKADDGTISLTMEYSNAAYGYTKFDWYENAMKHPGTVAWTGPYLDEVSGTTMLTSAVAIQRAGRPVGAVTVDIGITELEQYVRDITIGDNGYAFLVGKDGFYLASRDDSKNMKTKITEEQDAALAGTGQKILEASDLQLMETDAFGEDSYVMAAPLCIDNMKLVLVAPKSDYTGVINRSIYLSIAMALVVMLVLCLVMITIFNRRVDRPIHLLMEEAGRIAEGDLTGKVQVGSTDEMGALGASLSHMAENLKQVIRHVNGMSEQTAAASQELTASSDQSAQAANQVADSIVHIAEGAAEQAVEAQHIRQTAESVTSRAREMENRTKQAAADAAAARAQVDQGQTSIEDAVARMGEITVSTDSIRQSIGKLDDSSRQIAAIVDMITSIAEQTNLLALNAAIEAARAGEAGRGFAVVADEVRKLAEESNQSSQQIAELVRANQLDMEQAVAASNSGAESVRQGIETVQVADQAFAAIVTAMDRLTGEIRSIAAAIEQMAAENEQMLQASGKIGETSGRNSQEAQSVSAATEEQTASMHEIAAASRNLAELAGDLQAEMQHFRL